MSEPEGRPPVVAALIVLGLLVAGAVSWFVVGRGGGTLAADDARTLLDAAVESAGRAAELGEGRYDIVAAPAAADLAAAEARFDALGCATPGVLAERPPVLFGPAGEGVVLVVRAYVDVVPACEGAVATGPFLVAGFLDGTDAAGAAVHEAAVRRAADLLGP